MPRHGFSAELLGRAHDVGERGARSQRSYDVITVIGLHPAAFGCVGRRAARNPASAFPLVTGSLGTYGVFGRCPRQDSNLRTRLRRPLLYPLSYGGVSVAELLARGDG